MKSTIWRGPSLIFWHEFYKGAGMTLGLLLPLLLGFGAMMLAIFRQLHRHEEAM
jgi:hypothetical protein